MPTVTAAEVKEILLRDYDTVSNPSLTGFMAAANVLVNQTISCASAKGTPLSDEEAKELLRWVTAHLYCVSDKTYQSRSTEGASASFSGQTGMGFDSTLYGQMAMRLDPSNCLENQDKGQQASAFWLGTPDEDSVST